MNKVVDSYSMLPGNRPPRGRENEPTIQIEALFLRYKRADRAGKSLIFDEFCATWGHHRKHAIRLLRGFKRFTAPHPRGGGGSPCATAPPS